MRYMPGGEGLAVLDAETFDDGVNRPSAKVRRSIVNSKTSGILSMSPTIDQETRVSKPAKKRARAQAASPPAVDGADDQFELATEDGKRQRGRPRLDTKDQTAAERRRTQIRLAQRAYRNRKENAITTLEAKVKDLKNTNSEMSTTFMKLYEYAVNNGFLSHMPDFAQQLHTTTEKFVALSKKSNDDEVRDDADSNEEDIERRDSQPDETDVVNAGPRTEQPKPHALYGLIVNHEVTTQSQAPPYSHQPAVTQAFRGYEVIAQPTMDNASFPVGTMTGSPYRLEVDPDPWGSAHIPPPDTMSADEISFGRRLQRFVLERALKLISSNSPPPKRFAQVFGFCLLFETAEGIRDRLQEVLDRSSAESMHFWKAPFTNLGGSGTFYSRHIRYEEQQQQRTNQRPLTPPGSMSTRSGQKSPGQNQGTGYPIHSGGRQIGNYGLTQPFRPQHNMGFSMGPFDETITSVRDQRLRGLHINVPGWEGNFFDADEVEVYLQRNGVTITPGADYVKATIEMNAFTHNDMIIHDEFVPPPPPAPGTGMDMNFGGLGLDMSSGHQQPHITAPSGSTSSGSHGEGSLSGLNSGVQPTYSTGGWQPQPTMTNVQNHQVAPVHQQAGPPEFFMNFGQLSGANASFNFDMNSFATQPVPTPHGKKSVEVNIEILIAQLAGRATCLGRSPGFRPADINAAFWAAAQEA